MKEVGLSAGYYNVEASRNADLVVKAQRKELHAKKKRYCNVNDKDDGALDLSFHFDFVDERYYYSYSY